MAKTKKNISLQKSQHKIESRTLLINHSDWKTEIAVLLFFALFLAFFTTFKITGDDDVFWHLATGRYILEHHYVPSTDVFGYMTEGQPWMPFEWGWDVISYLIYQLGGFTTLSIFRTLIFILIFYIYYRLLKKLKIGFNLSILMLFVLAWAIIDRYSPRPHIFSYLFFSLFLYIIYTYRYLERNNYKQLFLIPLIVVFWSNLHMGIIAGMFLFGLYVFSEIIMYFFPRNFSSKELPPLEKPELIRLVLIFIASLLLMLLNPNGFDTYIYAYSHTKMKMLETVNEWKSPFGSDYGGSFVTTLYKILLFIGLLNIYYSFKTKDIFPAILYIGFALYSVRAMRFTVDYNLILFVSNVIAINFVIGKLKSNPIRNIFVNDNRLRYGFIGLMILLVLLIIGIPTKEGKYDLYLRVLKYYRVPGFGINSDFIPTQMFEFMKENKVPEIGSRIFNHFGTGGFFVWNFPDKKNFIDSRNLNDDIFFKYGDILSKRPGFEKKLDEYGIDYAIYLAPDLVRDPAEMQKTVISYFCTSPDWKLVFWDDKSFLWVRNIPKFKDLIEKYEWKYITPYTYAYQRQVIEKGITENLERVKQEIQRKSSEDSKSIVLNSILTVFGNRIK
ncbi:MAG: hypothetical protein ACPL2D_05000 [Ignavibacteria bacterium]